MPHLYEDNFLILCSNIRWWGGGGVGGGEGRGVGGEEVGGEGDLL